MGSRLYSIGYLIRRLQYLKNAGGSCWTPGSIVDDKARGNLFNIEKTLEELDLSNFKDFLEETKNMINFLEHIGNSESMSVKEGERLENYARKNRELLLDYLKKYEEEPNIKEDNSEKEVLEELKYIKNILEKKEETFNQFIESSPDKRDLEEVVNLIIKKLPQNGKINITGYFDHQLLASLFKMIDDKNISIKIISPVLSEKGEDKLNLDALKRMSKKGAKVKINNLMHARIIVTENDLLVGSADMKSNSFGGKHYEAGILSNSPIMLKRANEFFEKIWEDSSFFEQEERENS